MPLQKIKTKIEKIKIEDEKIEKNFFEILIYIVGMVFISSFVGLFFLSSELTGDTIKVLAGIFIGSSILAIIVATILERREKREKYTREQKIKNMERALRIRDD